MTGCLLLTCLHFLSHVQFAIQIYNSPVIRPFSRWRVKTIELITQFIESKMRISSVGRYTVDP